MNLLFITHASLDDPPYGDGSTRYRCFNVAEVARDAGHQVQVRNIKSINYEYLQQFDLISWLRPKPSERLFKIIDHARRRNIKCIADLDDLIVNPALAAQSPAVINQFVKTRHLQKRFTEHAQAVDAFDAITVSTDFLKQQVQSIYPEKPIATLHNGLSQFWLHHAQTARLQRTTAQTLAYLPGTRSHDDDFSGITRPLLHWLAGLSNRQLNIVGKIDISHQQWPASQVIQKPWVDYFKLPQIIAQCVATLAPLSDTIFNHAKSHVKFIESAAMGVPLIATPIADIARHTVDGLLLPKNETQWQHALAQACDPDFKAQYADSLMGYAHDCCTATAYTTPFLCAWNAGDLLPDSPRHLADVHAA